MNKQEEELEKEIKNAIKIRNKGICKTCGNDGMCWLLSPCPDCEEGKRVKKIGNKITKNLKNDKIHKSKR